MSTGFVIRTKHNLPVFHFTSNPDGALVFEYWPDEAQAQPSWVYIKGGLKPTKC